jgi:hypothetical protein
MQPRFLSDMEIDAVSGGGCCGPEERSASNSVQGENGRDGSSINVLSGNAVAVGVLSDGTVAYGSAGNGGNGGSATICA